MAEQKNTLLQQNNTCPAVKLAGVDVAFNNFTAVKDANLSVPAGQFLAIVGPTGCGKSTLLPPVFCNQHWGIVKYLVKNLKALTGKRVIYFRPIH